MRDLTLRQQEILQLARDRIKGVVMRYLLPLPVAA
jgi:hypothetical protein